MQNSKKQIVNFIYLDTENGIFPFGLKCISRLAVVEKFPTHTSCRSINKNSYKIRFAKPLKNKSPG